MVYKSFALELSMFASVAKSHLAYKTFALELFASCSKSGHLFNKAFVLGVCLLHPAHLFYKTGFALGLCLPM